MIMIQFYLLFIVIREIPFQLNGKRYLEKDTKKKNRYIEKNFYLCERV